MKLFETTFTKEELSDVLDILSKGEIGFGNNVKVFENLWANFNNSFKYHTSVNSASAAAFLIFSYLKDKHGICNVYTTSLGFTSPIWSAKHFGHNIIFVDVNDNLLFDVNDYKKRKINDGRKTVIMPVLYGGVSIIPGIEELNDELIVIDSAHCVTPKVKCDFCFFSFHPYKPVASSDGGMISSNDTESYIYFEKYKNFGRENNENGYDINHEGFKFYMNNLNSTIAILSLGKYEDNLNERKHNFEIINNSFKLLEHDKNSSYYFGTMFHKNANEIIKQTGWAKHYPLLHKTTYYNNGQHLENTEKLYPYILNIPLHKKIELNILK
jgi:dTDP-4-amino-4,6-dideoxygalactose transaminase